MTDPTRGTLFPERLPDFTRVPPTGSVEDLVEWFWIPVWDFEEGVASVQRLLPYPAANLVVEDGGVCLWGASTCVTERRLTGRGWAVGALLRPAALAALAAQPADLVDDHVVVNAPELVAAVHERMPDDVHGAAGAFGDWLVERVGPLPAESRLANDMSRLLMTDAGMLRLEDAASRLAVSPRTLQRLAHRTVGLSPVAMIRRRRLQEAAQRVRDEPDTALAAIAADLGYSDQAHLASEFRSVLGLPASRYRRAT